MKEPMVYGLATLLFLPLFAMAEAYKCEQANGSASFQDRPCQVGAKGSKITLEPSRSQPAEVPDISRGSGKTEKAPRSRLPMQSAGPQDSESRRAEEVVRAHNEEVKAYNKMQRCNDARRQLGVLKEARPVYRRDNKGDRQYLEDKDRAGEIAAAEQRVEAECR
jgi:hypothetical protein